MMHALQVIKKMTATCCIATTLMLSGCAGISDSLNSMASSGRLEVYSNVVDKTMVDSFYSLSTDGKLQALPADLSGDKFKIEKLTQSSISISKEIVYDLLGSLDTSMNTYMYEGESDLLAKKYIATAKKRDNIVRLYKPMMGKIINQNFKQPFTPYKGTREWYDLDNALIEFDKSGKIVSFMARSHQGNSTGVATKSGARVFQYTTIYMGPNARFLENKTKNSDFQEYFIREL